MIALPSIAIIDLGSQYTLLIERTLRELGFRSLVLDPKRASKWIKGPHLKAIILSGGPASVYDEGAPQAPEEVLALAQREENPLALLGICYGMQWIAQHLGGKVRSLLKNRDYGEADIKICTPHPLFEGTAERQPVWMSHGDSVIRVPDGFLTLAIAEASGVVAAIARERVWGLQFHPEVAHTPYGKILLQNFLAMAGCVPDWEPSSIISSVQEETLERLSGSRAVIGFSGGVDSSTLSAILSPVLKDRLCAVTIDGGQLREGELKEVRQHATDAEVAHTVIDAREEFTSMLTNTIDAEEKRRLFKGLYSFFLVKEAERVGATVVIQGTLAPDRIESGASGGALIKSHHNVGGTMGGLTQIHPLKRLFKYEVRALAQTLGLSASVWRRHPFPGPGLLLRIVGTPVTPELLELVRWADAQTRAILERHSVYEHISQLVVAYIGVNTVGVKGDARVYEGSIVVRVVETPDFMTARGIHLSDEVEDEISAELTRHPKIVRVWYDPTTKPPATTEME